MQVRGKTVCSPISRRRQSDRCCGNNKQLFTPTKNGQTAEAICPQAPRNPIEVSCLNFEVYFFFAAFLALAGAFATVAAFFGACAFTSASTVAPTLRRRPFRRMKPVASSWL